MTKRILAYCSGYLVPDAVARERNNVELNSPVLREVSSIQYSQGERSSKQTVLMLLSC